MPRLLLARSSLLSSNLAVTAAPLVEPEPASSAASSEVPSRGLNFDERLSMVSKSFPAFGGFYVDEEQKTLVILTTDRKLLSPSKAAEILAATVGGFDSGSFNPVFW